MCIEFEPEKRRANVLQILTEFVRNNNRLDELKDYLADLKEKGVINWCGCEGLFEVREVNGEVLVFMQGINCVEKYVINDAPYFELSSFSEAIPNYDEFINNDDDYELGL